MRRVLLLLVLLVFVGGASAAVPVISNVTNADPMGYTARVDWDTDIICDNRVKYSLNSDMSDSSWSDWENDTALMLHIQLSNLQLNTTYYYQAFSYNASDSANSTVQNFESLPWITRKNTSATIMWDINDSAMTGQVEYGLDVGYGNLTEVEGLSYWHQIEITGLSEGTMYHYRLKQSDYKGVAETPSCDMTFTTRTTLDLNNTIKAARIGGDMPKTYYVKTDGSDSNDGLSLETAWATPYHAAQVAEAGDTILVVNGTYTDFVGFGFAVDPVHHGIPEAPITMKAYNGTPVIAAEIAIRADHITLDGFTSHSSGGHGVDLRNVDGFHLLNYEVYNSGGDGIYFQDVTYAIIDNCDVHNAGWNGIGLKPIVKHPATGHHIIIKDTKVYDCLDHNGIDSQGDYMTYENTSSINTQLAPISLQESECCVVNGCTCSQGNNGIKMGYIMKDILVINNVVYGPIHCREWGTRGATNLTVYDNRVSYYNMAIRLYGGNNVLADKNEVITPEADGYSYVVEKADVEPGTATIRDEITLSYHVKAEDGATVTVEYTDGSIFTETVAGAPKWYPDKSNYTFNSGTPLITCYNITLRPTSGYLMDVTVNHESDVADDRTNVTANSSISNNPSWINATMQNASNTYNVSVNGGYVSQVVSDSDKIVRYQYTDSWSSHDFEFGWYSTAGFSGPPDPTNLQSTTDTSWVNHTWDAGSGNITDSFNVSVNSVWYNITTNEYYNNTGMAEGAWSNITVWAWNNTDGLSAGSISQNTQSDITPWSPSIFGNYYNSTVGYEIEITTKGYGDFSNLFSRTPTEADSNATSFNMVVTT